MLTCVIGHRGVGKSTWAKRMASYDQKSEVHYVDLDEEIEKKISRPIFDIILSDGEAYFREIEKQLFHEIKQGVTQPTVLILGAGFPVQEIPEPIPVLWIRRVTDSDGRIFLDRPRLNLETSPLAEYQHRAGQREFQYAQRADFVYWLPEGDFDRSYLAKTIEKKIFQGSHVRTVGSVTLNRTWFRSEQAWQMWKEHVMGRYRYLELRDDLLTPEQMQQATTDMRYESFIYSFRTQPQQLCFESNVKALDWALELGEPPKEFWSQNWVTQILSWHGELREGIEKFGAFANHKKVHLKLAPFVSSWKDLWAGYQWQQRDPQNRTFLPISMDQRWGWFRTFIKDQQLLNFVKEGDGSAGDQPTLSQLLQASSQSRKFAAVLGSPVYHSWSPLAHLDFFSKKDINFYSIKIEKSEWDDAIFILQEMGLKYAAVTSPLKEKAQELVGSEEPINTLVLVGDKWQGTSTDDVGFAQLIEGAMALVSRQESVAVWGGGGVLLSIQKVLPKAKYFSVRQGVERTTQVKASDFSPEAVVWCAPLVQQGQWPPDDWKPKVIVDVNYKENSLGREYAQRCACLYLSGSEMFFAQAQAQRVYWNSMSEEI
ncbi:MAG: shikimate kinase [Bdellovibrionia bacterium]